MKPEMKKGLRCFLAIVLSASILMSSVTGCKNESETGKVVEAEATYAEWNKTGEFTVTITSDKADLSDVDKSDIEVVTYQIDSDAYNKIIENISSEEEAKKINSEDYTEMITYPVSKVKNTDSGLEITFTDKKCI